MRVTISIDGDPPFVLDTGRDDRVFTLDDLEVLLESVMPGAWSRMRYLIIKEFFG